MKTCERFVVVVFLLMLVSCNKTSTVTVNIKQQSAGQTAIVSVGVNVLIVNTSNTHDFDIDTTSTQGTVAFSNTKAGSYRVSSEVWDGSKYLQDSTFIQLKDGKSADVNLLLR